VALAAMLALGAAQPSTGRAIALTFDDLPFVRLNLPYFPRAERVTASLLEVLAVHRAPAVGFVNEIQLDAPGERDRRVALLRQWVSHGHALGNHTYAHPDLNSQTIEQFQEQIVKGDAITRTLYPPAAGRRRFFRHPMTHTGNTRQKKAAIDEFLESQGYTIAPHTIENGDFIFNVPYARARESDPRLAARLRSAYLDFTMAATVFAESISPEIFGREVVQTLLLHANDLNADCLDELLTRYEARGYRFVALEQAMADPAYQTPDTLVTESGPSWLWRWMKSLGMNVSFRDDPDVPDWVMALYKQ
jgi:peptidoglycan/xylan/chitin deacetylase (PgdA/CDA1 family)